MSNTIQRTHLETELLNLLGTGRNAHIAARCNGFDGQGGKSFRSVGNALGLSRERIRQIVNAASAPLRAERADSPVLDRAIAFVADRIPAAGVIETGVIEAEMRSKGLTAGVFRLEGIIKAAELLGRHPPFAITKVNGKRLVHAMDIPSFGSIVHIARQVVVRYGIATVSDIAAKMRTGNSVLCDRHLVASVLACVRGFRWLDQSRGWFWSVTGTNPLLRRVRRILSVANPISLSELQVGIVRDRKMKGFSPTQTVLREFCLQVPGLRVHEDTIEAKPRIKPDEVLSQVERRLVRILSEHGGAMAVSELKSACLRTGLNRTTCYLYLVNSPIISNCGYHRYGLIGSTENLGNGAINRSREERRRTQQYETIPSADRTRNAPDWPLPHREQTA